MLTKTQEQINLKEFKEVEHIHSFGYYIGNYPSLTINKLIAICATDIGAY